MRPWATDTLLGRDLTDPTSPRSVHVAGPDDLRAVGPWSGTALYATVEAADGLDRVVAVDYDGERLLLAGDVEVEGTPLSWLRTPPALLVAAPVLAEPAPDGTEVTTTVLEADTIRVTPPWDVLVPAFDLEEMDEELPPVETARRPSSTGAGAGTGTPG